MEKNVVNDDMLDPIDVVKAAKAAKQIENEGLIVKVVYKSKMKAMYAAILVTIDLVHKSVVDKFSALSHEPEFLKIVNENSSYKEMHAAIKAKKKDNLIPIETLTDLQSKIASAFTEQVIETLNVYNDEYVDKDKYFEVISSIKSVIIETMGDDNAYVAIGIDKINRETIEKAKSSGDSSSSQEDDFSDIVKNEDKQIIKVASNLVLSPIYGRAVAEIEPGDVIMVIIENTTPNGKMLNTQLNAIDKDGKVTAVPVIVVKKMKKEGKKGVTMILKLADGVYSTVEETDPVRIQTYDDLKYVKEKGKTSGSALTIVFSLLALGIFAVIAVAIYFMVSA